MLSQDNEQLIKVNSERTFVQIQPESGGAGGYSFSGGYDSYSAFDNYSGYDNSSPSPGSSFSAGGSQSATGNYTLEITVKITSDD